MLSLHRPVVRTLGLAGMTNLTFARGRENQAWEDCDKAMPLPDGSLGSWPGYQRVRKVWDATLHGASSNRFDIIRLSENDLRKNYGHGLVLVDRNSNTNGRIIALSHVEGLNGTSGISQAKLVSGTATPGVFETNWDTGIYTDTAERIYKVVIDNGAANPDTFKWSRDNGATYAATGVTITSGAMTLEDGITITWPATNGYTLNDTFTFSVGGYPALVGTTERVYPHEYIPLVGSGGKTLILNPLGDVLVDDGFAIRPPGLPGPRIKPGVQAYRTGSGSDLGDTANASNNWVGVGSVTTARTTGGGSDPETFEAATAMIKITVPQSVRKGGVNLAYTDEAKTIAATVKSIRLGLYIDAPRGWVDTKVFSVVVATSTALGGTTYELPIRQRLKSKKWQIVELPWSQSGSVSQASIGLKLRRSLYMRHFTSSALKVYIANITQDAASSGGAGQTETSTLLADSDDWYVRFSWYNRNRKQESPLSPINGPFQFNGVRIQLDLAGYYTAIAAGLPNTAPDDADAFHIYIANSAWDTDPRLSGRDGKFGLSFFRLTDLDGEDVSKLTAGANGELFYEIGDEMESSALNAITNARDPFWLGPVRGGLVGIVDGQSVVTALTPSLRVGNWAVTSGRHVVTPVTAATETTPVPGAWMEGRLFMVDGDLDAYVVIKYIAPNATYTAGALYIGKDFDPTTQDFATAYQGTTNATAPGIILGDARRIYWTNKTETSGSDIESMSVLNQLEVMPIGDQIRAAFKVGEFLNIMGSANAFAFQQNAAALSDLPADTGVAYSNPLHIVSPGIIGPRMVDVYQGLAYIVSPRGELWVGNGTSFERHAVSGDLAAFLMGKGLISDTRTLADSWLRVFPSPAGLLLYIGVISGTTAKPTGYEYRGPGVYRSGGSLGGEDIYAHPGSLALRWPFPGSDPDVTSDGGGGLLNDGGWAVWQGGEAWGDTDVTFAINAVDTNPEISTFPGTWNSLAADQEVPTGAVFKGAYLFTKRGSTGWEPPTILWREITAEVANTSITVASAWGIATPPNSICPGAIVPTSSFVFLGIDSDFTPIATADYPDASRTGWLLRFRTDAVYSPPGGNIGIQTVSTEAHAYAGWTLIFCDGSEAGPVSFKGGGGVVQSWDPQTGEMIVVEGYDSQMPEAWTDPPSYAVLIAPGSQTMAATDGTLSDPEPEALAYSHSRDCAAPAVDIDTAALARDFEVGVLVNLDLGIVTLGSQCPWTTPGMTPAGSCTAPGQAPSPLFFGDKDGYVDFAFDPTLMTWGSPGSRVLFEAAVADPGDTNTMNVKTFRDGETVYGLPIYTDSGGNVTGLLAGLVVRKFTPSTLAEEYRTIASNTASSFDIDGFWNVEPAVGDIAMIAPLDFYLRFAQARSKFPRTSQALEATVDIDEGTGKAQASIDVDNYIRIDQFGPKTKRNFVNVETPPVKSNMIDLERAFDGDGLFWISPVTAKSIAYGIRVTQPQYGPIRLSDLKAHELASALEPQA